MTVLPRSYIALLEALMPAALSEMWRNMALLDITQPNWMESNTGKSLSKTRWIVTLGAICIVDNIAVNSRIYTLQSFE